MAKDSFRIIIQSIEQTSDHFRQMNAFSPSSAFPYNTWKRFLRIQPLKPGILVVY